ncbi:hypothetical protein I3843_02G156500 [Carya illinoinensis]|nr:hypothetical protein I3843_02G156500 [Carya illinoinensis]
MERLSERERPSKRAREDLDHRDRDHKHRSSKDEKRRESDHHHRHRSRLGHSHNEREGSRDRDSKLERSYDDEREREGSRERDRPKHRGVKRGLLDADDEDLREGSDEGEGSLERRHSHSHKRKERGVSEERSDGGEKKARVSGRRRFEDRDELDGEERKERNDRRLEDRVEKEEGDENDSDFEYRKRVDGSELKVRVKEEVSDEEHLCKPRSANTANANGLSGNGAALESLTMESRSVPESYFPPSHHIPTKVSSISTTNENKGVIITRSHEVPGKSSTDGTSSAAGKSGSLSLDALAKAKKALQMQKDLSEKLKKIPFLNKGSSSIPDGSLRLELKEGLKAPSVISGTGQGPNVLTAPTNVSEGMTSTSLTLPSASAAAFVKPPVTGPSASAGLTTLPNIEAVKRAQELAARMGFRQDPEFAPLINLFPGQTAATEFVVPQKPTKAPVLRLDALGREIDEHGNVVNVTKPSNLSTLKVNINKQKKEAFQILRPELDVDPETNPHFDERMGIDKTKLLRPKRMTFQFVEEGKWSKEAEHIKLKSKFGEAQAKEQKAKQAQLAKAKAAPDINPNLIEVAERIIIKEKPKDTIPEIEWWDATLLQAGAYGDIVDGTMVEDKLKKEKITIYVQHPRPIEPPAEPAPTPPQPLKLTKKEQKKLRTQRRLAREKDKQEMIRQGLIEPPKPKVKMSNLMKVLGSEATQDPTRLEKEIRSAAAEREQAHIDRNIARKLTPAERHEKKERKLFDEPNTVETNVSVYRINDLSHVQTRFKIDVNAQENRLTGCAVISDGITVVVVEGGNKSIKRYGKLMLRRINWATAVKEEDEDGDDKPAKRCVLVWQGSVAKSSFNRFTVHECMTEAAARKIFADAGVAHYWELAINFSDDQT